MNPIHYCFQKISNGNHLFIHTDGTKMKKGQNSHNDWREVRTGRSDRTDGHTDSSVTICRPPSPHPPAPWKWQGHKTTGHGSLTLVKQPLQICRTYATFFQSCHCNQWKDHHFEQFLVLKKKNVVFFTIYGYDSNGVWPFEQTLNPISTVAIDIKFGENWKSSFREVV